MSAKETSSPTASPAIERPDRPAVLDLIGNTPLVPVNRLDTGPCQLFLKLESQNPGGSIKDRIGLSMIEAAERDGLLPPGGTVVEATAGNTGLGLALVARAKGYRVVLVVPDKMSAEKVLQLKALGAEVHITRSDVGKGHPDYYQDRAARLVRDLPGAWYADQFNNPNNPLAHETTTGPEIWQQVGHRIDALVCGVGSGGTITGLSRFFAKVRPGLDVVLADPAGSILKDFIETGSFGEAGSWAVEGIGEDFVPPIADLSGVRHAYAITDEESFATARELLKAATKTREALLDVVLRFGLSTFDFTAAFAVIRGVAAGWAVRGEGANPQQIASLSIPLDAASVFRTVALTHSSYLGPVPTDALTKALAKTLAPQVRVLGVSPGVVDTSFVPGRDAAFNERVGATIPLKRVGTADDVAAAIVACCTSLRYATGSVFVADGGRHLG